jgi:hypothetical protein
MEYLPGFNVANHFEKRQLLIAINCVAALSIFFFGYDLITFRNSNALKIFV